MGSKVSNCAWKWIIETRAIYLTLTKILIEKRNLKMAMISYRVGFFSEIRNICNNVSNNRLYKSFLWTWKWRLSGSKFYLLIQKYRILPQMLETFELKARKCGANNCFQNNIMSFLSNQLTSLLIENLIRNGHLHPFRQIGHLNTITFLKRLVTLVVSMNSIQFSEYRS